MVSWLTREKKKDTGQFILKTQGRIYHTDSKKRGERIQGVSGESYYAAPVDESFAGRGGNVRTHYLPGKGGGGEKSVREKVVSIPRKDMPRQGVKRLHRFEGKKKRKAETTFCPWSGE